jgi:hypothetical protein
MLIFLSFLKFYEFRIVYWMHQNSNLNSNYIGDIDVFFYNSKFYIFSVNFLVFEGKTENNEFME